MKLILWDTVEANPHHDPKTGRFTSVEGYHVTGIESAGSIEKSGFMLAPPGRRGGYGGVWGPAVYISTDKLGSQWYENLSKGSGSKTNLVRLKVRADVQNVLEWTKKGSVGGDPRVAVLSSVESKHPGVTSRYTSELRAQKALNRRLESEWREQPVEVHRDPKYTLSTTWMKERGWVDKPEGVIFARIVQSLGYDAVRLNERRVSTPIGGSQLIVFDPSKVRVVARESVLRDLVEYNKVHDPKTGKFAHSNGSVSHAVTDDDIAKLTHLDLPPEAKSSEFERRYAEKEALSEKARKADGYAWGLTLQNKPGTYSEYEEQYTIGVPWGSRGGGNPIRERWATPPPDHKAGEPTKKAHELVDQRTVLAHMLFARERGQSLEEFRAEVTDRFKAVVNGALETGGVFVRVRPATLEKILDSGRIKSQFETDRTAVKSTTEIRRQVEGLFYGYKADSPNEQRPIYGYLSADRKGRVTKNSAAKDAVEEDWLDGYGPVAVKLKSSVHERTTISHGDSIDVAAKSSAVAPVKLTNPDWHGALVDYPSLYETTPAKAKEYAHDHFTSREGRDHMFNAKPGDTIDSEAWTNKVAQWSRRGYVEAQVHGQVKVSDIERVVFHKPPTSSLKKRLRELGIEWEVVD